MAADDESNIGGKGSSPPSRAIASDLTGSGSLVVGDLSSSATSTKRESKSQNGSSSRRKARHNSSSNHRPHRSSHKSRSRSNSLDNDEEALISSDRSRKPRYSQSSHRSSKSRSRSNSLDDDNALILSAAASKDNKSSRASSSGHHKSRSPNHRSRSPKPDDDKKRSGTTSRATMPGAISENSNTAMSRDSIEQRKERRTTKKPSRSNDNKASKPGAIASNDSTADETQRKMNKEYKTGAAVSEQAKSNKEDSKDAKRRSTKPASNPGVVAEDVTSQRIRRKEDRNARSSNKPTSSTDVDVPVVAVGDLLKATTVDDDQVETRQEGPQVEQMRREIEELNRRHAAETAEREAKKQRRKQRTRRIIIVFFCCLFLIAAVLGTSFALQKDDGNLKGAVIAGSSEGPTTSPSSDSVDGNGGIVSNAPSYSASNAPAVSQQYDAPSLQECLAISRNETIAGQSDLDQKDFDMAFDVTLDTTGNITDEEVQNLLVAIQEKLLPPLAGCPDEAVDRRGLMIRGSFDQQRTLAIDENRFIIFNAFVTGSEDPNELCLKTLDSNLCHRIVVNLSVILKGPIERFDIVRLISETVSNQLKVEGQDEGNLASPLDLSNPFSEIYLVKIDNQETDTTAPSPAPIILPPTFSDLGPVSSQAPSTSPSIVTLSPSSSPTLAPVSGSTPPPSARPSTMPSEAPSLQPSAEPSLTPTAAPVAGPTLSPSNQPSGLPSIVPSSSPTSSDSQAPSFVPSNQPSMIPSSPSPSIEPSMNPSSSTPSTNPSMTPSLVPSTNPSDAPSVSPQQCIESNEELSTTVDNWFGIALSKEIVENTYGLMGDWCFGVGVTDITELFKDRSTFNEDISRWDVSAITTMERVFFGASDFNQDLSPWDVSAVTSMQGMFNKAIAFNQDLSSWEVSSVENMGGMFANQASFNQDISSWDVSSVEYMNGMFENALSFDQNLSAWDVSGVTDMSRMFYGATSFNQNVAGWNVSSLTNLFSTFRQATSFNQDLCAWGPTLLSTGGVDVRFTFSGASQCPSDTKPSFSDDPPGPFCHLCS